MTAIQTGGSFQKIKLRKLIVNIIFCLPFAVFSQADDIGIKRQVIGAGGQSFQNSSIMISSTVGEAVIGSAENSSLIVTQGFHQSSNITLATITYDYAVKDETCPDTKDGVIILSDFEGCENGEYTIQWDNGEVGSQLTDLSAGWYGFSILACGVMEHDSVLVGRIYENSCLLVFYTAFSPNGDGVNDTWEIDNINAVPNDVNTVSIFDRWGNKVIDFTNYNNSDQVWKGKDDKGKDVTEGTYYFQAKIMDQNYSGYIEVTR